MGRIALKRGQPVPDTAEAISSLGYRVVKRGERNVALSPFVMDEDSFQVDLRKAPARNATFSNALEEAQALAISSGVAKEAVEDPSFERRIFTFTGSTETVDRYGSRVLVDGTFQGKRYGAGWDFGPFRKNPVIMPFHMYETFPVGRALDVWTDKKAGQKRVRFQVLFGDGSVSPLAPLFVNAYATKEMRSVSVGWWPHAVYVPKDDKEAKELGVDPVWGVLFATNELWELSPVAIPGNPEALVEGAPDIDEFILPEERDGYLHLAEKADSILPTYAAQIRTALKFDPKATVAVPASGSPASPTKVPAQEGVGGGSDSIEDGGAEELLHRELDALMGQLGGVAAPPAATAAPITEPPPAPAPDSDPAPEPESDPEPVQEAIDRAVAPIRESLSQVLSALEKLTARVEGMATSTSRGVSPSDPLYVEVLRVADEAISSVTRAQKRHTH